MKTIPLLVASLKGFTRNWKSVVLLIVVPLLLIASIFAAFNPTGITKIPIGLISTSEDMNKQTLEPYVSSFLEIDEFATVPDCIQALQTYQDYVCIQAVQNRSWILNVHFDNTRAPIIWEVLARIESSIDFLQKDRTKKIAQGFLTDFSGSVSRTKDYKQAVQTANEKVDVYAEDVKKAIRDLQVVRTSLRVVVDGLDEDVTDIQQDLNLIESSTSTTKSRANSYLSNIDNNLNELESLGTGLYLISAAQAQSSNLDSVIDDYIGDVESLSASIQSQALSVEKASVISRRYLNDLDTLIIFLEDLEDNFDQYEGQIGQVEQDITSLINEFEALLSLDVDTLANPVVVRNHPVYVPQVSQEVIDRFGEEFENLSPVEKIIRGVGLINLQTIFPMVLLLLTIFLSLLVSSFMCLNEINSPANSRVKLIKGIFLHEFIAIYLSSLIILVLPITSVLFLGEYLFDLQIMQNIGLISLVLFLLASIFCFIGMGFAYMIRKESITLLISTFILVFVMFFSGFLLPLERMTAVAGSFSVNFPGSLAWMAVNKVVFYAQDIAAIHKELAILEVWFVVSFFVALIVKKIRE